MAVAERLVPRKMWCFGCKATAKFMDNPYASSDDEPVINTEKFDRRIYGELG